MDLFRDKYLVTKEYFEKKPVTPEEETLTQQLNLTPLDKKEEENEEEKEVPGRVLGQEALQGKIVGIYFSASWCPPCQQFIPLLCNMYDELLNRKANFEVVFLSFDKTAEDMESYFRQKHRDWYALPFDDPFKDELKAKYNVTAVPKFIIINKDGEVISLKGRKEVQDKGVIAFRNWAQASSIYEAKQSQNQTVAENNNTEGSKEKDEDENEAAT
ncbi:nucleoredoxin-like protein 2 [Mercenaria mercenaria]|uniref:nucleoredoxin-like protein 2 n=1 Tax=Mercenaria mercenaria TaxID=6596 RepID=UPI00234F3845|nr:nucleoredoxin-like protein 2 [Mercenaria mercenaria]